MRSIFIAMICLVASVLSYANNQSNRVFVKDGNVYFSNSEVEALQLTNKGQDKSAVLSPDKRYVVFLRKFSEQLPINCSELIEDTQGHQIWIVDIQHQRERLLVNQKRICDRPTEMILEPMDLTFSPDSKTLYFLTYAWTTSAALHAVDISDGAERYLLPANSLKVIQAGEYKGYLAVNQHRYFVMGGSYDWYWLFTPEGKEVGPLGDELSMS